MSPRAGNCVTKFFSIFTHIFFKNTYPPPREIRAARARCLRVARSPLQRRAHRTAPDCACAKFDARRRDARCAARRRIGAPHFAV